MAWLESHDDIWEHFKMERLQTLIASELPPGLDPDEQRVLLVGHLHALWHFTLRSAWSKSADLTPWGEAGIERAMKWRRKPGALVAALRESGFLDGFTPHGWMERAGSLVKKRLGREDERRKEVAGGAGPEREPDGTRTGAAQSPTGQDIQDNQDNQDRTNTTSEAAKSLTLKLVELMLSNDAKAKIPSDLSKWEAEADKLLRLDGRTPEEAGRVLVWSQRSDFWKSNIQSMGKFREKFPTLLLQSKAQTGGSKNGALKVTGGQYANL